MRNKTIVSRSSARTLTLVLVGALLALALAAVPGRPRAAGQVLYVRSGADPVGAAPAASL